MYTSDIDISEKAAKTALTYLIISIVCALFGAVYEIFSHEVYSFYMIYAFVFPLLGGVFPFLMMCVCHFPKYPCIVSRNLYHSGIATVTVGSIVCGVLEIYGTTNRLTKWYWYVGIIFLFIGSIIFWLQDKIIVKK